MEDINAMQLLVFVQRTEQRTATFERRHGFYVQLLLEASLLVLSRAWQLSGDLNISVL